jgi:dienelactone hydrolase
MDYDPFARGPFPVGVQSQTWHDASRNRDLSVEIWYAASDAHLGQDHDPSTWDRFLPDWAAALDESEAEMASQQAVRGATPRSADPAPLILLIHGWAGYRREATFIGTHLASHGYLVVSPDVPGSTWTEVDAFLASQAPLGEPHALREHARSIAEGRVGDIGFLIDSAMAHLNARSWGVGVTGASFGGFSSLIAPTVDSRVAAIAPMCPANDDAPILAPDRLLGDPLEQPWKSDAATLILAADRDSLLPLYGQLGLLRMIPASDKRLVSLARADHNHFVDDIELGHAWMAEFVREIANIFPDGPGDWPLVARSISPIEQLVPGEQAKLALRGLTTAHFDAHLRDNGQARVLLADIDGLLAGLGIDASTFGNASPIGAR